MTPLLKVPMDQTGWQSLLQQVEKSVDILEDGAIVRTASAGSELLFYATELNQPQGWNYPFSDPITDSHRDGAIVGRAYHDEEMSEVVLVTEILAAVQVLTADYESGIVDLDYVAYENAVAETAAGTEAEQTWLQREWDRFIQHILAKKAAE